MWNCFCEGNNQTITKSYAASAASNQLAINFTTGTLETNSTGTYDGLIIHDGDNTSAPIIYNSDVDGNIISGRTFVATSGNIYTTLVADGSISCANFDQTALVYTITLED